MSESIIYAYQDAVRTYLSSLDEFDGLTFLSRREGRLMSDIAAGKATVKIAAWVWPVLPIEVNPNVPGPQYGQMEVRVTIFENYDLNFSADDHSEWYCREILRQLHHKKLSGLAHHIYSTANPITFTLTPGGVEQWDVLMTTRGGETPVDNS